MTARIIPIYSNATDINDFTRDQRAVQVFDAVTQDEANDHASGQMHDKGNDRAAWRAIVKMLPEALFWLILCYAAFWVGCLAIQIIGRAVWGM